MWTVSSPLLWEPDLYLRVGPPQMPDNFLAHTGHTEVPVIILQEVP